MKTTTALIASAILVLGFSSCDKHSWEQTKVLHEGTMHAQHAGDGHEKKADGHEAKDTHGTKEGHGEAKKTEAGH